MPLSALRRSLRFSIALGPPIQTPSQETPVFLLFARDSHQHDFTLLADPVTANLKLQPRTWLYWTYELHVNSLFGEAHGVQINGIGALCLLLLVITGLVLWWPGVKIWARGLRIGFRHNWRRINYDVHNAVGFWTLFIVFWWALSGIYFAWYRQVTSVVALVSPIRGMLSPPVPTPPKSGPRHVSLEQILATVHQQSPADTYSA
jgi:uncharacterized iron-regulated membrane protein